MGLVGVDGRLVVVLALSTEQGDLADVEPRAGVGKHFAMELGGAARIGVRARPVVDVNVEDPWGRILQILGWHQRGSLLVATGGQRMVRVRSWWPILAGEGTISGQIGDASVRTTA